MVALLTLQNQNYISSLCIDCDVNLLEGQSILDCDEYPLHFCKCKKDMRESFVGHFWCFVLAEARLLETKKCNSEACVLQTKGSISFHGGLDF